MDLATRTIKVRGQTVKLARTEYALLRYIVQHACRVLTHTQLLREIWDLEDVEKTARLRVYVAYLREKLETNPAKPGVGYRLEVLE